ncbi:MAG: GAF domain-containing sensor histidine kinase [Thainema sp.]
MLYLSSLFEVSRQYIPHGHCYLWQPELVWLHIVSDTLTAVAYYSIPLMLLYFVRKRQDVPFQGVFLLFSAFILACGTTHVMEVVTLWHPVYWLSGTIKLMTASISLYTAYTLVGLIPQALALPSPAQLEAANLALIQEIQEREQVERTLRESENRFRKALASEALLKRITEKIRDSLDEQQIVQTAVEELVQLLNIEYCEARFLGQQAYVRICNRGSEQLCLAQCAVVDMMPIATIEAQIQQGEPLQFCEQTNCQIFSRTAALVVPIVDNQQTLGALWLFKPADQWFEASEVGLIQQVANQCAIAVRQARLYQAAQAQVEELERLNRLKDDFLSTVSHELRTPMSNMNMALHMLDKAPANRLSTYLHILRTECDREIELINSLLDLQRLEAQAFNLEIEPIDLAYWLPTFLQPFQSRCQEQQQTFQIEPVVDLPILMSDLAALKRILAELLNNACKYTPPRGAIYFQVQTVPLTSTLIAMPWTDEPITRPRQDPLNTTESAIASPPSATSQPYSSISPSDSPINRNPAQLVSNRSTAQSTPNSVQFIISNQATIAATELPHIFDKFYRVPNADPWKRGGTGLGLALVKKLVEHLKGSIHVTSDTNLTCFIVDIPHYP